MFKLEKINMSGYNLIIDRFEEDKAVLVFESGEQLIVAKKYLPSNSKTGDVISLKLSLNKKTTETKKKMIKNLWQKILSKNKNG